MGTNLVDEIDCGNFFDQIDDLIEFPPEDDCCGGVVGNLASSDDYKDVPSMWNDLELPESFPVLTGSHENAATSDLSAELSVPYEDIVQLEWLSNFVEDSFSGGGMTLPKVDFSGHKKPSHNQFQMSSPISVLESSSSSSSSSGEKTTTLSHTHRGLQRARSKRPRPATFNPRAAIQLISSPPSSFIGPPQSFPVPGLSSESENFADSPPPMKHDTPSPIGAEPKKKKKKIKMTIEGDYDGAHQNPPPQGAVRKCLHCEITKTPQWRAGPMGPKTLCNACGVRYKSGRLFPEYRPAASPTFVPSVHSNSHKKVLEMRGSVVVPTPRTATAGITIKTEFAPGM